MKRETEATTRLSCCWVQPMLVVYLQEKSFCSSYFTKPENTYNTKLVAITQFYTVFVCGGWAWGCLWWGSLHHALPHEARIASPSIAGHCGGLKRTLKKPFHKASLHH